MKLRAKKKKKLVFFVETDMRDWRITFWNEHGTKNSISIPISEPESMNAARTALKEQSYIELDPEDTV